MSTATAHVKALDLFAGTGWGVACQRLGIKEAGVEIMPEAVQTRTANGMETIYNDVWDGLTLTAEQHREQYGSYGLLIASPPCQTFSMAGNGKGREALNEVIEAIELHAYKDAEALRTFGEKHDMRTALVLTPLAYVWRDRPRLVAMEQVPTVLPVWEACAEVMREWGYEVKVEVLNAEQYGVPQTRKRAILVARRGGPVHMPVATHSRYYSRTPDKLDPGVQKWVSMREALGWTPEEADGSTYTGNNKLAHQAVRTLGGFIDPDGQFFVAEVDQVSALQSYPTGAVKNMGKGMIERHGDRPGRTVDAPAFTVRASAGGTEPGGFVWTNEDGTTRKATQEEASVLQSYPVAATKQQTAGRTARYGPRPDRSADAPAFTIVGHDGHPRGGFEWRNEDGTTRRLATQELAALQSYPVVFRNGNQVNAAKRPLDTPAPTLMFGARSNKVEWIGADKADDPAASGERVTVDEAGTLQTYERPFVWCGSKSKQFLQIGNAVPPLLAEHVLAALIGIRPGR